MLMNLFILWSIVSLLVLVYAMVFRNTPLEEFSNSVPKQKADTDPTESVPYQIDMTKVVTGDDEWAA